MRWFLIIFFAVYITPLLSGKRIIQPHELFSEDLATLDDRGLLGPLVIIDDKLRTHLNLNNKNLSSLDSLPAYFLENIDYLHLADNHLRDLCQLTQFSNHSITKIDLRNNNFTQIDVEEIQKVIAQFTVLRVIDLRGNPLCVKEKEILHSLLFVHAPEVTIRLDKNGTCKRD